MSCLQAKQRSTVPHQVELHIPAALDQLVVAFGVFIIACGTTHFVEAWTIWHPLDSALGRSFPAQVLSLGTALSAAVVVYLLCCRVLKVRELDALLSLRTRLRRA